MGKSVPAICYRRGSNQQAFVCVASIGCAMSIVLISLALYKCDCWVIYRIMPLNGERFFIWGRRRGCELQRKDRLTELCCGLCQ